MSTAGRRVNKFAALLFLPVPLLAVSGCTSEKTGTPTTTAATSSRPVTSTPAEGIFGDLKACDLLEPVTSAKGFGPAAPEDYQSDNGCRANKPRYGTATTYLVEDAGISDLKPDGGQVTETTVAGKKAVEVSGGGGKGNCLIGISVTEKSRATVSVTLSSGTNEQSCADAKDIAEQIAPKLPQGG
ncbi:DUF3558 family protein [Amycolatopsis sp. SB7-3]|uniref:DUF3558 family protein n=1 Tax=Amycolatopsis sp. SB7-3 TaxID=3373438 RepID=UPI00374253C6